jgi:hypothetical protein
MNTAEKYTFSLAMVVPVRELEEWFAAADPGARAVYAVGFDLPHGEPGVALVREWIEAGAVRVFRERDGDGHGRFRFLVERCGDAARPGGSAVSRARCPGRPRNDLIRVQMRSVMTLLRRAAERGERTPTGREIAVHLAARDLPRVPRRLRERVRYILRRLEVEGQIARIPPPCGAQHGPTVTILTGRAKGKSTKGEM